MVVIMNEKKFSSKEINQEFIEKEPVAEKAKSLFFELLEDKPISLTHKVGELLQQGKFQEIPNMIESCPDISELKNRALELMQEKGLLRKEAEGWVADIDKMKEVSWSDLFEELPYKFHPSKKSKRFDFYDGRVDTNLYYIFRDTLVISRQDFEQGKFEAKPLFYIPENEDAAYDSDKIREVDVHLAPWELSIISRAENVYTQDYQKVDEFKSATAFLLYNFKYGAAERDDNGELQVTYPDGNRRPITEAFFDQYLNKQYRVYLGEYLDEERLPELTDRGLLSPSDFQEHKHVDRKYQTMIQSGIPANGLVSFYDEKDNLIRYYIGKRKEFTEDPNIEVIKLNKLLAVIIKNNPEQGRQLSHYFNLTNFDDPDLSSSKPTSTSATIVKTADINLTQTRAYNPDNLSTTNDEEIIRSLRQFERVLTKANRIHQLTGVDILKVIQAEADWEDDIQVLADTEQSAYSIAKFIKQFGPEKLLIFLDSSVSIEDFGRYISLGENLAQATAEQLLIKYDEIKKLAKKTDEELAQGFYRQEEKKLPISPTREIVNRAQKILLNFADDYSEAKNDEDLSDYLDILKELEDIQTDIVLFASIFKIAQASFEEIRGLSLENTTAEQLTNHGKLFNPTEPFNEKEEKGEVVHNDILTQTSIKSFAQEASSNDRAKADLILELIQMYRDNYKDSPLQNKLVKGFLDILKNNNEQTNLYVLKKDDKPIAFCRFDKTGEHQEYFGSLNVQTILRGSKIGTAFIEETLNKEAIENDIDAHSDPNAEVSSFYIEKAKFVVDFVQENYDDTGVDILHIVRNRDQKSFSSRAYSEEGLVTEYNNNFLGNRYSEEDKFIVLKFRIKSPELVATLKEMVNDQKYFMTRYFFVEEDDQNYAYCVFEKSDN